jgi:hypothetical protein
MGANPYIKFLGPEDHLQHQLIVWLQYQFPKLVYHHSPNEGKRSTYEQFKYKYLGSDSGFPDLLFASLELVIELKVKPNKPTEAQLEWLEYFRSIGWRAEVCYNFEEAQKVIQQRMLEFKKVTA